MVNRLLQPQEIEVFYVLPALRRELAVCMKSVGKSQKEIAKLLGVTEPAVSQYMSSKRASQLKFNDKLKIAINESAGRITSEISLMREMQRLVHLVRSERVICQVHEALGGAPKNCNVCFDSAPIQITRV
ncbi:MAG TPA: helix-turn-helix domain-containing protein [Candidatus Nanoarchaeia archaeon]|nr:helix-turn-helix domain-containing protein [Candidatus Nanoarchaeia archaeon]